MSSYDHNLNRRSTHSQSDLSDEHFILSDKTRELLRLLDEESSHVVEEDLTPLYSEHLSRPSNLDELSSEDDVLTKLDSLLSEIEGSRAERPASRAADYQGGHYSVPSDYHRIPQDYAQTPRGEGNRTGLALLGASIMMSLLFLTHMDQNKVNKDPKEGSKEPNREKVTPPTQTANNPQQAAPLKITDGTGRGIKRVKARAATDITAIVLHDTDGTTAEGAISTLLSRGYGYHYLIDRDGRNNEVIKLVDPKYQINHAKGGNTGTIGISMVGGYRGHPVTPKQIEVAKKLIQELKKQYPSIKFVLGHKDIQGKGGHNDPRGVDMPSFAKQVGLQHDTTRRFYAQEDDDSHAPEM